MNNTKRLATSINEKCSLCKMLHLNISFNFYILISINCKEKGS